LAGALLLEDLHGSALVLGVAVRVHEGDGDRVDASPPVASFGRR